MHIYTSAIIPAESYPTRKCRNVANITTCYPPQQNLKCQQRQQQLASWAHSQGCERVLALLRNKGLRPWKRFVREISPTLEITVESLGSIYWSVTCIQVLLYTQQESHVYVSDFSYLPNVLILFSAATHLLVYCVHLWSSSWFILSFGSVPRTWCIVVYVSWFLWLYW